MKLRHYSQGDYKTNNWSGGSTTELYIYPEEAQFQERNFEFRISSATIEIEESDFTPFPGYHRLLMVLEKNLLLIHDTHYCKYLQCYESDSFEGSWNTRSMGRAKDLNVIMREGYGAEISLKEVEGQKKYVYYSTFAPIQFEKQYYFLYALEDGLECEIGLRSFLLKKEELLHIDQEHEDKDICITVSNNTKQRGKLLLISIHNQKKCPVSSRNTR